MGKIKNFWEKHKVKIVLVGSAIVLGTVTYLFTKELKHRLDISGKDAIIWKPNDSFINLEGVKEILELNKDNNSAFAIFREGLNPNEYAVILLDDAVVTKF